MKKLAYILLITISLTGCQKCKKNQEPITTYSFRIPQELYDYAYFKVGTYWVYQDSVTNIIDSVYITYAKEGVYENAEQNNDHYKGSFGYFQSQARSSYDHYDYQNWVDQSWNVNGQLALEKYDYTLVRRDRLQTSESEYNSGEAIFISDVEVGKTLYTGLNSAQYQQFYINFSVKTNTFNSTQKWYCEKSVMDDKQNTYYYIAKNIGVVKRVQLDSNHTWNLIRYHIVQ